MTDKEQIIIDGIIINACLVSEKCKEFETCKIKNILRLLARKTQEINNIHEYYKELRSNATELANKNIQLKEQLEGKEQELYLARNEVHSKTEYIQEQRDIIKQLQQECEELKKEIINKNDKIKELRFSVSDLTNRLCYLNAEKSFKIVDLEQTLDEIEKELKEKIRIKDDENSNLNKKYRQEQAEKISYRKECEELKDTLRTLTRGVVLPTPEPEVIDLTDRYRKALAPFQDEYFKGLDTTTIAELAKKSIRLTTENRKLETALEEIERHFEHRCDICRDNYGLGADCSVCWHKDIRNIISKAKGEENAR